MAEAVAHDRAAAAPSEHVCRAGVRARRRDVHGGCRRLSRAAPDRLAAHERDPGAVRRPRLARRNAGHGPQPARRRTAPLPLRLGRRASRRRTGGAARGVGLLRRGQPAAPRRACRAPGRKGPGIVATILGSASWMLLFHGVYGRMYSLFLFTSLLSFLALEAATETGGRGRWAAGSPPRCSASRRIRTERSCWPPKACISQRRGSESARRRGRSQSCSCSAFRSGAPTRPRRPLRGRRRRRRRSPRFPARRLALFRRDGGGLRRRLPARHRRRDRARRLRRLPTGAHAAGARSSSAPLSSPPRRCSMLARFGSAAAPESRHLIFALPFFLVAVATGLLGAARSLGRVETPALVVSIVRPRGAPARLGLVADP